MSSIYLFNRDLRINDNICLYNCLLNSNIVYPIFIVTNDQIKNNKYYNERSIDFMCRSLYELCNIIPLCILEGDTIKILKHLIETNNITSVYNNFDVSPYARNRSLKIKRLCKLGDISFMQGMDIFFVRNKLLTKENGRPYLKYTPFYNNAIKYVKKDEIKKISNLKYKLKKISQNNGIKLLEKYFIPINKVSPFIPGINGCQKIIKKNIARLNDYHKNRDYPYLDCTSHLSPYIHLGIIGPQQLLRLFYGLNKKSRDLLIKQLLWREFYLYIIWMSHNTYSKQSITIMKRNKIKWNNNKILFKKWCEGKTGVPIVDAGMRQLNMTGYMHNRLRMIVAMFLIFYLQINWIPGEKYFAQNLTDYDYCNNLGGWLWCASWEVYSNDINRVFSMKSQSIKYDKDCLYIKKWIPEMKNISCDNIHNFAEKFDRQTYRY